MFRAKNYRRVATERIATPGVVVFRGCCQAGCRRKVRDTQDAGLYRIVRSKLLMFCPELIVSGRPVAVAGTLTT